MYMYYAFIYYLTLVGKSSRLYITITPYVRAMQNFAAIAHVIISGIKSTPESVKIIKHIFLVKG